MKIKLLYILIVSCLTLIFTNGYSAYMMDKECASSKLATNYQNLECWDFTFQFPNNGQFDNGATGWTSVTEGGGQVISYSHATEGWVGLRCGGGQTATIEFGPISMSTTTTGTARPSYDWDQIACCLHFRGNPLSPYNSRLSGKLQLEFRDAVNSEVYTAQSLDLSCAALNGVYPLVGLDSTGKASSTSWASFAWQFTPPHQNWYRISKVRISYTVPNGVGDTTEVQLDQFYVFSLWVKNP